MASQDASQSNPSLTKQGKEKQQRRLWTMKEEEALLKAMLEKLDDTMRADNGFRTGFFVKVEKELQKLLPGTTLKANPNIESNVKGWKEKYGLITDMIKLSGFAWNHERCCIDVDDPSVWSDYEKTHKGVKGMNGKAFPMYEAWQMLFGKDRATGEFAEDAQEAQRNVGSHTPAFDDYFNDCYTPRFENDEPIFPNVDVSMGDRTENLGSPTPTTTPTNATSTRAMPERTKKKSKISAEELAVNEGITNLVEKSNVVLEKIADAVGYENKLSARRTSVFLELKKLEMEEFDRFRVNNIINAVEERVDTFFGIPDDLKQIWVIGILEGKITFD